MSLNSSQKEADKALMEDHVTSTNKSRQTAASSKSKPIRNPYNKKIIKKQNTKSAPISLRQIIKKNSKLTVAPATETQKMLQKMMQDTKKKSLSKSLQNKTSSKRKILSTVSKMSSSKSWAGTICKSASTGQFNSSRHTPSISNVVLEKSRHNQSRTTYSASLESAKISTALNVDEFTVSSTVQRDNKKKRKIEKHVLKRCRERALQIHLEEKKREGLLSQETNVQAFVENQCINRNRSSISTRKTSINHGKIDIKENNLQEKSTSINNPLSLNITKKKRSPKNPIILSSFVKSHERVMSPKMTLRDPKITLTSNRALDQIDEASLEAKPRNAYINTQMERQKNHTGEFLSSRNITSINPIRHEANLYNSYTENKSSNSKKNVQSKKGNDNFVKLNMRNSSGSCRGAKAKSRYQNLHRSRQNAAQSRPQDRERPMTSSMKFNELSFSENIKPTSKLEVTSTGTSKSKMNLLSNANVTIDPVDDYLDGVYHGTKQPSKSLKNDASNLCSMSRQSYVGEKTFSKRKDIPICSRHLRPCKLITVKTNKSGNKGRKFYACSLPRGEQCNHFEWAEDTISAVRDAILKSSTHSGFVSRQVSMYAQRFRSLTIPELKTEAKKRGLANLGGKKEQILTRLLIWIRDEVVKGTKTTSETCKENKINKEEEANLALKEIMSPNKNLSLLSNDTMNASMNCFQCPVEELSHSEEELRNEFEGNYSSDDETVETEEDLEIVSDAEEFGSNEKNIIDEGDKNDDSLHESLRALFGYKDFRFGQEWAIRRCLSGKRTLFVAPTGIGKSLCYTLPAAHLDGITIVVSPLVSLIQDQLRQLPPSIPAATLSGSLSKAAAATVIDDLLNSRLKILFLSPERLASSAFLRLLRPIYNPETKCYNRLLPDVSLFCVDEAHCVSQWGHNFRPSYLRLKSLLTVVKPRSLLALTATAGPAVIRDICKTLGIPQNLKNLHNTSPVNSICKENTMAKTDDIEPPSIHDTTGIKILDVSRDNIDVLSMLVDSDSNRRQLLLRLLIKPNGINKYKKDEFIPCGTFSTGSVIVYVWRQRDAEAIAEQLSGSGIPGGVVFYHGGMNADARARAQSKFMRGKARVCVATVAFGMGINKSDISGIIHMCLPPSLEHYVQEIGRAGRDGRDAIAVSLITTEDVQTRLSLSHSDGISRCQLQTLMRILRNNVDNTITTIKSISKDCSSQENNILNTNIDVAIPLKAIADAVDCKSESLETIFSILEDDEVFDSSLLSVRGYLYDQVIITLKKRSLQKLSEEEPLANAIERCGTRLDGNDSKSSKSINPLEVSLEYNGGTASQHGYYAYCLGTYSLSVLDCARYLGPNAEPRHIYSTLRRLQNSGELEIATDTSHSGRHLHLRMSNNGLTKIRSRSQHTEVNKKEVNDSGFDEIINTLLKHFDQQENNASEKVKKVYHSLYRMTDDYNIEEDLTNSIIDPKKKRSEIFNSLLKNYFSSKESTTEESELLTAEGDKSYVQCLYSIIDEIKPNSRESIELRKDIMNMLQNPALERFSCCLSLQVKFGSSQFVEYTSRAIAKFLHGIESPRTPMKKWYVHPLWGKWKNVSFNSVHSSVFQTLRNLHYSDAIEFLNK